MTKKEMAMFNEMVATLKTLNDRIEKLENGKTISRSDITKSSPKKSTELIVGNLIFTDNIVRTGSNYMTSKARYAIGKSVEEFGGVKLSRDNEIVKKFAKKDKYVQVYEFKTATDCKKFMAEQQKRVG